MDIRNRDINIIKRIIEYCNEINETVKYFGDDLDKFKLNNIYRNAVSMCILQIGELTGSLSEEFMDVHNNIPWRNIKGMRNIMAHKYGNIDKMVVWEAVKYDIPSLKNNCVKIIDGASEIEDK
ncbi:HepT-like ribonuclease domain-containing protein [Tissierella sp.]|uniref:HepT-like ribonuclease domain-containing protein n=1 Tax=Tissierella sp. TaxID=41274 RepID=UPI002855DAB0|nr:HepT-like ribonuclease domain-containing protein [Tissierella sp.]MDR7856603.1 DUF86 domain-containing protein [Tissierella sp.]